MVTLCMIHLKSFDTWMADSNVLSSVWTEDATGTTLIQDFNIFELNTVNGLELEDNSLFTFSNPFSIASDCDVTFTLDEETINFSPALVLSPTSLPADDIFTVTLTGPTSALNG